MPRVEDVSQEGIDERDADLVVSSLQSDKRVNRTAVGNNSTSREALGGEATVGAGYIEPGDVIDAPDVGVEDRNAFEGRDPR